MTSASYVTGSHAFKAGIQYGFGLLLAAAPRGGRPDPALSHGVPAQVIIHNTPQDSRPTMNADQGIYAQDSWTLGRFTINPGVRFEHFNSSIDGARRRRRAASCRAGTSPARPNVPNWNDVSPRFGFAWDVQGNGKTAVKFGTGKYMRAYSTGLRRTYDPNFYTQRDADLERSEQRRHRAGRLSYLPTARACRASIRPPAARSTSRRCRRPSASSRRRTSSTDIKRPYQIETNVSVQREIIPGTSVTVQLLPPRLQEPDLVRQPRDRSVGLHAVHRCRTRSTTARRCTIYNLNPAKASAFNLLDQNSRSNYAQLHRLRRQLQQPHEGADAVRRRQHGAPDLQHLPGRGPELPALLRSEPAIEHPDVHAVQAERLYIAAVEAVRSAASFQSYNGDARNATVDTVDRRRPTRRCASSGTSTVPRSWRRRRLRATTAGTA